MKDGNKYLNDNGINTDRRTHTQSSIKWRSKTIFIVFAAYFRFQFFTCLFVASKCCSGAVHSLFLPASRLNVWQYKRKAERKTNLFTEFSLMNLVKYKKNPKRIKKSYKKRVHTRGKWNWTKLQRRRRQMYMYVKLRKKEIQCGGYAWRYILSDRNLDFFEANSGVGMIYN